MSCPCYTDIMTTITIPKNLMKEKDLMIIPRKQYELFLNISKQFEKRLSEEQDTNQAILVYKNEKKEGKLKVLKSLASFK